jgi:Secretion system C-terminal sorting domain
MRLVFILIVLSCFYSANGQYNFYFGNIHSHSSYSDGNKDSTATGYYYPGHDYYFAKGSYHMDFLGISEHNHYSSNNNPGMHVAHYGMGLYQADTANNNGSFVSMYGMEWGTISQGGHVVVYGVPALIGWESGSGGWGPTNNYDVYCAKGDFTNFWPIVRSYPTAFCTLAHPETGDYGNLLDAAPYEADTDSVVAGVAVRSGSAFSVTTDYSDPPAGSFESKFLKALAKGYHVGPTIDHDNHNTTFGRTNKSRTVVLATSLHRDSIMAAFRANRFSASDDWNAQVNFTINGKFMGTHFTSTSNSSVSVTVSDPDAAGDPNDNTSKIEIFYGVTGNGVVATLLSSNTGSSSLSFGHASSVGTNYYYFAKITQVDGNIIWTAPIWVNRTAIIVPLELTRFTGVQQKEEIRLIWTTAQEINADYFEVERSFDGSYFEKIGRVNSKYHTTYSSTDYHITDAGTINGLNFYRLKQFDLDGSYRYSDIIAVMYRSSIVKAIRVNPNPVISDLNITLTVSEKTNALFRIYTAEGREVKTINSSLVSGKNIISSDINTLPNGTYIVVVIANNERVAETRFVKQ